MKSIDVCNDIRSNYFVESCGVANGIGAIEWIYNSDTVDYYNYTKYGRDDDPMSSETVTLKITQEDLVNGELVKLLNSGKFGRSDWQQGEEYPVFGSEKHIVKITSRNEYDDKVTKSLEGSTSGKGISNKNINYESLYDYDMLVKYSDGTQEIVKASEGEFSGFDFTVLNRPQLVKITYKNYEMTFVAYVWIEEKTEIKAYVQILGDSIHGEDGTIHTYKDKTLEEWLPLTECKVYNTSTVADLINIGTRSGAGGKYYTFIAPDLEYVRSVKIAQGITLANGDNGANSGWSYTLNGIRSNTPISQQVIKDGDVVVLYYSDDLTKEGEAVSYKDITDTIALIDAIGEVTLERGKAIEAAESAYNALTDDQKALVENYDTLLNAREEYDRLVAEEVEKLLNELPTADEVTLKDGSTVKAARAAYNKLTENQKKLASEDSLKKLEDAEAAYDKLMPKTGDSGSIVIYAIMLVVAAGATGTVVYRKKKKA